jgi:glycosyltransferase involved in cell wall biosynthesis
VGGVPEIIPDESIGILAEPADPSSLARALRAALDKRWDTDKLVQHGLKYSWENISKRVSEVYAETGRMCG